MRSIIVQLLLIANLACAFKIACFLWWYYHGERWIQCDGPRIMLHTVLPWLSYGG